MCLTSARYVPRAPLPTSGVTFCSVPSSSTSEGITPPSSLIWAHEPDQSPLPSFGLLASSRSPCRLLPAPAGRWPIPMLSPYSLYGCRDPYPAVSFQCTLPFLPGKLRSHLICERFDTPNTRRNATSTTVTFRGCSHSFMFQLPYLLAPLIAPTAKVLRL